MTAMSKRSRKEAMANESGPRYQALVTFTTYRPLSEYEMEDFMSALASFVTNVPDTEWAVEDVDVQIAPVP